MEMLATQLSLDCVSPTKMILSNDVGGSARYSMSIPPEREVEPDVYLISFDSDGDPLPEGAPLARLDLREGRYVRITNGVFRGDYGEVLTPNRQGHYRIVFKHTINKSTGNKVPMQRVLGCWWVELGCSAYGRSNRGRNKVKFPIASCSEEEAKAAIC